MAYIPSKDVENGILVSLNVEAIKTAESKAYLLKAKTQIKDFSKKVINKVKREYQKLMK